MIVLHEKILAKPGVQACRKDSIQNKFEKQQSIENAINYQIYFESKNAFIVQNVLNLKRS